MKKAGALLVLALTCAGLYIVLRAWIGRTEAGDQAGVAHAHAAWSKSSASPKVGLLAPLFMQGGRFSSKVWAVNEADMTIKAQIVIEDPGGRNVLEQSLTFEGHSSK